MKKAMEISPGSIEPYLNAALVYEQKRLWDRAESYLKRGLDYIPDSHAALFILARISFEQEKIPQAKYYLSQAYRVNPNDRDTQYFLGLIAQREANPHLQKAADKAPPSQPQAMEPLIHKNQGRGGL